MSWKLWIDDERLPPHPASEWVWENSSCGAASTVGGALGYWKNKGFGIPKHTYPSHISFDHDLGGSDTVMIFLKWFQSSYPEAIDYFTWDIHSENPIGKQNIESFLNSWKQSRTR